MSYSFQMFSQQFCTSLIFIESYCAFSFIVNINQSQIWNILSISKVDLFVIIIIGKIILLANVIARTVSPKISYVLCQLFVGSISFQVVPTCSSSFLVLVYTKKSESKPRTIVAQFNSFNDKTRIPQNSRKLNSTRIPIYEDYSKQNLATRQEKWKEVPSRHLHVQS